MVAITLLGAGAVSFLLAPALGSVAKSTTGILGSLTGSTGLEELEPGMGELAPGVGELELPAASSSKLRAHLTPGFGTGFAQSGTGTGGRGSLDFDFTILGWLELGKYVRYVRLNALIFLQ